MERLIPTLLVAAVVCAVFALFWFGWRRRVGEQSSIPVPQRPVEGVGLLGEPVPGSYVATTTAGDPLDRIAAHGLGLRTDADLVLTEDGIVLDRAGTGDILLPWTDVESVRAGQGMIGKFVEPEGLIIITWRLGDTRVDTGFRTRAAADRTSTIDSIRARIGEA